MKRQANRPKPKAKSTSKAKLNLLRNPNLSYAQSNRQQIQGFAKLAESAAKKMLLSNKATRQKLEGASQRTFDKGMLLPLGPERDLAIQLHQSLRSSYNMWEAQILLHATDWDLRYQLPGLPYTGLANYNNLQTTVDYNDVATIPAAVATFSRLEGETLGQAQYGVYAGLVNQPYTFSGSGAFWIIFDYQNMQEPIKIITGSAGPPPSYEWFPDGALSNWSTMPWTTSPYVLNKQLGLITEQYGVGGGTGTALNADYGNSAYCGGASMLLEVTNMTAYTAVSMRAVSDCDMVQRFVNTLDTSEFAPAPGKGNIGLRSMFTPGKTALVEHTGSKWYLPVQYSDGPIEVYIRNSLFNALRNGFPIVQVNVTNTSATSTANVVFSVVAQTWIGLAPTLSKDALAQPYTTTATAIPPWVRGFRSIGAVGGDLDTVAKTVASERVAQAAVFPSPGAGPQSAIPTQRNAGRLTVRPSVLKTIGNVLRNVTIDAASTLLPRTVGGFLGGMAGARRGMIGAVPYVQGNRPMIDSSSGIPAIMAGGPWD